MQYLKLMAASLAAATTAQHMDHTSLQVPVVPSSNTKDCIPESSCVQVTHTVTVWETPSPQANVPITCHYKFIDNNAAVEMTCRISPQTPSSLEKTTGVESFRVEADVKVDWNK